MATTLRAARLLRHRDEKDQARSNSTSVSRKLLLAAGLLGLCAVSFARAAPVATPVMPDADASLLTQVRKGASVRPLVGPSIKSRPPKGQSAKVSCGVWIAGCHLQCRGKSAQCERLCLWKAGCRKYY